MASPAACLVLFTKPARPGRVKTRLIGDLTPAEAAALHAAFFADLHERLRRGRFALAVAWALDEDEPLPPEPGAVRQRGADLGERLFHALGDAARFHDPVAAVGSDHPDLPRERVDEAFAELGASGGADVVLGPAADGGYYLIALRAAAVRRELFAGIPWSTGGVLAATLDRCRSLSLATRLLAPAADVDTPADLLRLAAELERQGERGRHTCPRTTALLREWGRLPLVEAP